MDGLFSGQVFRNFGPNSLVPESEPPALEQVHGRRPALLRGALRAICPQRPGVYGMLDVVGKLIYVGKAKQLRSRLLSYFRRRSRDPKAGRILGHTRSIVWEFSANEFTALLRELELIQRWQPRFNVQGQPRRRRRTFVCLGRRPAPYLFLSRRPAAGVLARFGPVPGSWQAHEAVRRLNDHFQLRDCSQGQEMIFSNQEELFPILRAAGCLRYEIATCLGPCVGACSSSTYQARVRSVRAFLEGKDLALLDQLEKAMTAASTALEFEKAADLRDQREVLQWLLDQLQWLQLARQRHSFIYPVSSEGSGKHWYLIQGGRVAAAIPEPRDRPGRLAAATKIEGIYLGNQVRHEARRVEEVEGILLVARWFRRYPEERGRVWKPEEALALCRQETAVRLSPRGPS